MAFDFFDAVRRWSNLSEQAHAHGEWQPGVSPVARGAYADAAHGGSRFEETHQVALA